MGMIRILLRNKKRLRKIMQKEKSRQGRLGVVVSYCEQTAFQIPQKQNL